jgi:ankyrin repeat protein
VISADTDLRSLITVIAARDTPTALRQLAAHPTLATARLSNGATRQAARCHFINEISHYVMSGDTALHIAAAAYFLDIIRALLAAGADIRARNRLGSEPIHYAASGNPNSPRWNPEAQAAAIELLISAGADPNALNKNGVAPLHQAVRNRGAAAVPALGLGGAEPPI